MHVAQVPGSELQKWATTAATNVSISICANQVKGTLTYEYKENVLSPTRYSGAFYPHHCIEEQTNQTYNISEKKL